MCPVKYRVITLKREPPRRIPDEPQEPDDVHTGRNTERIKNNIQWGAVGQEGHILTRKDARNNALVTVASRHLVTHAYLALLGDIAAHHHIHAGAELIAVLTGENLDVNHNAVFAMGYLEDVSRTSRAFSPNIARSSRSSAVSSVSP